jgi:hypothetical protein
MYKDGRDSCAGRIEFKNGYQPRTNFIQDEKGDLLADSHSILNIWKNHCCRLLNVYGVSDIRQAEFQTAEPLVPKPTPFEVETIIEEFKRCKPPDTDQIPAELI